MAEIKIEHTQVFGFEASLRASRNPHNSHNKSDSRIDPYYMTNIENFKLGEKDAFLSKKLTKAGSEHAKHLRFIQCWVDLTLPRYLFQEIDQYAHKTTLSESTMHKITSVPLKSSNFYGTIQQSTLVEINILIHKYNKIESTKENKDLKQQLFMDIKNQLPESFMQKRTLTTNYAQLLNIYHQRKNHRLPQWQIICKWIEELPYFKELTGVK